MLSYLAYSVYYIIVCWINRHIRFGVKNQKRCFFALSLGIMLLQMGLRRNDIGNDTGAYVSFFQHMHEGDIAFDSRIEYGFRLFTIAVSKLTSSTVVFNLLCVSAIILPIALLFWKEADVPEVGVLLFWFLGCINLISPTRQGIASAIIVLGYLYYVSRKKLSTLVYCISCIIAFFFHMGAIILIVMPVLLKKTITTKAMLILFFIMFVATRTNIVGFIFSRFAGEYYSGYLDVQSGWAGALFSVGIAFAAIILDSSQYEKISEIIKIEELYKISNSNEIVKEQFLRWATVLYAGCSVLSVNSGIMGREAVFFLPFVIVYISMTISRSRLSKLIYPCLVLALVGYNVLALIIRPEWNSFFPFHYFWESIGP